MEKRVHSDRYRLHVKPAVLESYSEEDSLWRETEAEVQRELARGEDRARLLKWVRRQMGRRLTLAQRQCIELYYFEGLTYTEVGNRQGCSASSACRSVKRGLNRLRAAARTDPPSQRLLKRRRQGR